MCSVLSCTDVSMAQDQERRIFVREQGGFGFFERRVHKVRKARKIQTNAAIGQKDKLLSLRGYFSPLPRILLLNRLFHGCDAAFFKVIVNAFDVFPVYAAGIACLFKGIA